MKIEKTENGHLFLSLNIQQLLSIGGLGICDRCGCAAFKMKYVGALNMAFCYSCFDEWNNQAVYYEEDSSFEKRYIDITIRQIKKKS